MMEMLGHGTTTEPHLKQCYDFKNGKLWPNERPGLGVDLDLKPLQQTLEVTQRWRPTPMLRRPDGSITNW